MNRVILIGNLTKDPELTQTTSGISVCRFTLAVGRRFTNADGSRDTDFLNIVAWRNLADNLAKYMKKGSQICVEGQIQVRNFEDNGGVKRYVTEVICDNIHFLESKGSRSESGYSGYNDIDQYDIPQSKPKQEFADEDPFKDIQNAFGVSSDDLPF